MPSYDHYFTAEPASADERRWITIRLRGQDVRVMTAPGVFSGAHLDHATDILLREVPDPPRSGHLLDLGCGWGPIALAMAMASPEATVWAVDVNERALDLVRRNAEALGCTNVRAVLPHEVDDVAFAACWSNPPVRIGKPALHALLEAWLPRLEPEAEAHLVVGKNLGADSLASWIGERFAPGVVERVTTDKGFRVLRYTAP